MKKSAVAILLAIVALFAFRALVLTIYTIEGNALEPMFKSGDRIMVNRWSYGLRAGEINGIFGYGRRGAPMPDKGDIIAFDHPLPEANGVFVGVVKAMPGDTLHTKEGPFLVPGEVTCDKQNYYVVEMGKKRTPCTIPEASIIGRVVLVVYNHDDSLPFYTGFDKKRCCLLPQ